MAVTQVQAKELAEGFRSYPVDKHGKLRVQHFEVEATAVAGDAGSLYELCKLPPGRVRVFPYLSRISISAQGASRTLDAGHLAYDPRPNALDTEAADPDAFSNGADVSAAAVVTLGAQLKWDFYSTEGVTLTAQINDGTTPIGTTLTGVIVYACE